MQRRSIAVTKMVDQYFALGPSLPMGGHLLEAHVWLPGLYPAVMWFPLQGSISSSPMGRSWQSCRIAMVLLTFA